MAYLNRLEDLQAFVDNAINPEELFNKLKHVNRRGSNCFMTAVEFDSDECLLFLLQYLKEKIESKQLSGIIGNENILILATFLAFLVNYLFGHF